MSEKILLIFRRIYIGIGNDICFTKYIDPAAFPDLGSALDDVDAVVVATPPSTHVPLALQAIEAGKHVLVEKPFATSSPDAHALMRCAPSDGRGR